MLFQYLLVGIGGSLGAISRFLVELGVNQLLSNSVFPYGTLAVNFLGCLIIGVMFGLISGTQFITPRIRLIVITGFLGALTTFSSFGHDTFALIEKGYLFIALVNVVIQVILGLVAVWFGLVGVKYWIRYSRYKYLKRSRLSRRS